MKTDEKSNEITTVPKLLELLRLEGCIVTLDAMGCQRETTQQVVDKGAHDLSSLKGNQEKLHQEVERVFTAAREESFETVPHETLEKDHGRIERRRYWITAKLDGSAALQRWACLSSVGMVEAERTIDGKTSKEIHYFISSLPGDVAKLFAAAGRRHWEIENNLHWVLDVAFREDDSRIRKDNAPRNSQCCATWPSICPRPTRRRRQASRRAGRRPARLPRPPARRRW